MSIKRPNWANGITLTNETTAEDITNYIDFKINEYTKYNFKDKSLWESYQEDFDNFTVQIFKDANRSAIKRLKQLLRRNGVWVFNKKSKSVPQALDDVAHEDDRTEWSDEEIQLFIKNEGPFNSYAINYRLKSRSSTPLTSSATLALALAVSNDLPPAQAPSAQAPPTQAPSTEAPPAQAPPAQAPPTQAPPTEALPAQAPSAQAPPTQASSAQAPSTQAPSTQAPPAQAPLASPSPLTKAKDLRQPSSYKPPQPAQQQHNSAPTASNDLPPTAELPLPTNVTAPPTYNPDTACCLPCKSAASKITSTARPKRQRALFPPTAFASYKYYINRVYIWVVLRTKKELPVLEYIDRVYRLNDCAVTPAIRLSRHRTAIYHRQTDRTDTPAIYRPNDRACTPATYRPTDRRALRSTTITTAAGTALPPEQTTTMPLCL
jgi:hypothetical protein